MAVGPSGAHPQEGLGHASSVLTFSVYCFSSVKQQPLQWGDPMSCFSWDSPGRPILISDWSTIICCLTVITNNASMPQVWTINNVVTYLKIETNSDTTLLILFNFDLLPVFYSGLLALIVSLSSLLNPFKISLYPIFDPLLFPRLPNSVMQKHRFHVTKWSFSLYPT